MPTDSHRHPECVLITGANGNLGHKLISGLMATKRYRAILALDVESGEDAMGADPHVTWIPCDLARHDDKRWIDAVRRTDAIVHLAAQNPRMWSDWADAAASFDMTARLATIGRQTLRRFVFASSNHVMGGYKETEVADMPGALNTELPPKVGTRTRVEGVEVTSTPYASAKLMGERMLAAVSSFEGFTSVSLRIGWCQRGENRPETISGSGASGMGPGQELPGEAASLRWFRNMWLSDADFVGFVDAALRAETTSWPAPAVVVNAISANSGTPWEIASAQSLLGYTPSDDLWRVIRTG